MDHFKEKDMLSIITPALQFYINRNRIYRYKITCLCGTCFRQKCIKSL